MKRSTMGLIYLIQGIQNAGIDLSQKLKTIGIDAIRLDPQVMIHRQLEWKIHQYIVEDLDPTLGLSVGKTYSISGYGPFLMLLLTAKDVEQVLKQAMQFQQLTYLFGQLECIIHPDDFRLIYRPVQGYEANLSAHAEIAGTYRFIQDIYRVMGFIQVKLQIHLALPQPKTEQEYQQYQQYYGEDVQFDSKETTFIGLDKTLLTQRINTADPIMHEVYKQQCVTEIRNLTVQESDKAPLITQIQDYLHLQLGNNARLQDISHALHMPERTLRHQLALQQTSFQKIKEDILKNKAIALLKDEKNTVERIAQHLGYAETAAFNHAFKRWFGDSPKQFLKRHHQI